MRRPIMAVLFTIGLAGPALAQPASPVNGQDLRQAAEAIGQKYDSAYNGKNAAAMASLYTEDATFVPPGPVVHGRQALQKYYQGRFDAGASGHMTKIDQVQPLGDGGYGVGQFSVTAPGPNGTRRALHGNIVAIYRHESDGWKLALLTANVVPAR